MNPLARCVVVGGAGTVGKALANRLSADGLDVRTLDRVDQSGIGPSTLTGNVLQPDKSTLLALAAADVVIVALPESTALKALPVLHAAMHPTALWVDTLSTKKAIEAALLAMAPTRQALSINPMFAPSLAFTNRAIATTVLKSGPAVQAFLKIAENWGARLIELAPEEHDRVAAAAQVLTHATVIAFGSALASLNLDVRMLLTVAPPPHAMLLCLLARIATGNPEVYWDVQRGNPHAASTIEALKVGAASLHQVVADGDELAFVEALRAIRHWLRNAAEPLAGECAQLFDNHTKKRDK